MPQPDHTNYIFHLAADFINHTNRHVFLTGKAGTGKTTFLKHIKEHTKKNTVVVAPTGVAAINAGGVTMHSFFQLPFGPFIPGSKRGFGIDEISSTDKHSLFRNIRFTNDKKVLLQEMELLIIDEVSMVRADMLDAIDTILRHFRNKPLLPFGGVQVLYIGDLFQLPPVVPEGEWYLLREYYNSSFFFDAKVIAQAPPLYIELKKIYRQNEQEFIDILNRVRNNDVEEDDLMLLNSLYKPGFQGDNGEYIVLSTHNRKADDINAQRLAAMPGKMFRLEGKIEGDFSDKALPTEQVLQLKVGAQVMFLKNDLAQPRRYYNGKIATISHIDENEIMLVLSGSHEELKLEKETWRNIRYTYNQEENTIEEEEIGSFTQFPIRLAWAITIHKSQGLTFERAIIDAGYAFAPGQVYVALSRCTSLDGLVLHSRIGYGSIKTDQQVIDFAEKENEANELVVLLEVERKKYQASSLLQLFDWYRMQANARSFAVWIQDKKVPDIDASLTLSRHLSARVEQQQEVAARFGIQLNQLLDTAVQTGETDQFEERVSKAIGYFTKSIYEDLITPLREHMVEVKKGKSKKYLLQLMVLESDFWHKLEQVWDASYADLNFTKGLKNYLELREEAGASKAVTPPTAKGKVEKGSSRRGTLELYLGGKSIADIAVARQLAVSTVESHLAQCVEAGEIELSRFVPEATVKLIMSHIRELGATAAGPIKERVGPAVSFAEIRAVQWYLKKQQEEQIMKD
ncbi:MAG TPA: helix-turn-helix domain-containing protein [Chitinophaga sp.]|uniref:helix-turn-helix domain-containing protein n=1 Tax=Chitinophaga sp. TaxID=1869181 RepID=UPI002C72ADBC|nr:helix-turn-helix domain-containing protein [Chitinophaga sp.]HVI48404.1 helix-turn-helix domain-containing protein [Chitinophaga sp.]